MKKNVESKYIFSREGFMNIAKKLQYHMHGEDSIYIYAAINHRKKEAFIYYVIMNPERLNMKDKIILGDQKDVDIVKYKPLKLTRLDYPEIQHAIDNSVNSKQCKQNLEALFLSRITQQ